MTKTEACTGFAINQKHPTKNLIRFKPGKIPRTSQNSSFLENETEIDYFRQGANNRYEKLLGDGTNNSNHEFKQIFDRLYKRGLMFNVDQLIVQRETG